VLDLMAALGITLALALVSLAPTAPITRSGKEAAAVGRGRDGFGILTTIGALDTATHMGYLLFLPFLIHGRGGGSPTVGLALALLFIGGAFEGDGRLARRAARCNRERHGDRSRNGPAHRGDAVRIADADARPAAAARYRAQRHLFGALWHRAGTF
jgi:hypothetical protein